jgi:prepilin-type N-terminal cleavage/methylation domain-containing protein
MQRLRGFRRARQSAGFTLVELMTVVAIVGVMAAIAVILVNRHVKAAKSIEATAIIQSIRACQEARRAETASYLNVSVNNAWYPKAPNGKTKTSWVVTTAVNADADRWQLLGVSRTDGTQFGFKTWAGVPGAVTAPVNLADGATFPNADDYWYVIEAAGDIDRDNTYSLFIAKSWDAELQIDNETE